MVEPKQGAPSSRSWRGGRKKTNYDGPSNAARIFWTVAFFGLMGVLIYLLLWRKPEAQLGALRIIYEQTTPIPFCDEDAEAYAGLEPGTDVRKEDRDRADTIFNLWGERKGEGGRRNDPVIIYLAARGVSDPDGTAWLLCSGYQQATGRPQGSAADGRYSLHELLAEAKKRQAPLKLLILDVSFAVSNPAAGMMVNEFPALLAEEVKKIDDDKLWVLTNAQALEVEHFSESAHRSAFSFFVTEGLRGEADVAVRGGSDVSLPRHDGIVDLDELYDFVLRGVGDWVQKHRDGLESQTPCLYHAGKGLVQDVPPGLHLRYTIGRTAKSPSEDDAPEPPLHADYDDLVQKAWEQHDDLDRARGGWTAVDYAPHLWRYYEDTLIDYEFRLRCGAVHASRKTDLKEKVIDELSQPSTSASGVEITEDNIIRLNLARRQFQQQQDRFQAWAKSEPLLCKAFQARNQAIRLAAYGLRWHRAILDCNVNGESFYATQMEHLRKLLSSLQKLSPQVEIFLAATDQTSLGAADKAALESLTEEVANHAKDLYDSWQKEAKDLAKMDVPANGRAARIEAILAVPAVRAKERMALLKARRAIKELLDVPEKLPPRDIPQSAFATSPEYDARIAAQAELEQAAARLAVPAAKLGAQQLKNANGEALQKDCEQFGGQLVALESALRDELSREAVRVKGLLETGQTDRATVAQVDRVVRWADARDVKTLNFLPPPSLGAPPQPTITVKLVRKTPSKEDTPTELLSAYGLKLSVAGTDVAEAEFSWDCDSAKLASAVEVHCSSGQDHLLSPGVTERMALVDNTGEVDLSIDLRKALSLGPLDSLFRVKARAVGQSGESTLKLHVPGPDNVRLLAFDAAEHPIEPSGERKKIIQLRPFPNHETAFLLKVKNESETDKDLTIDFVAPRDWETDEHWEDGLLNERHELVDSVVRLVPSIPLKVSVGKTLPIPFVEPPPADKAADKSAADKPADKTAAKPAAPGIGENVTKGFAVLISDTSDKKKHWVQRIAFKPWKPSDYLEGTFDYNESRQELHASLKAKDNVPFPLNSASQPIEVHFGTDPRQAELEMQKIQARSQNVDFGLTIVRDVSDKGVRFFFDVDGYPHALQFISPDWVNQPSRIVPDDTVAVKITSPRPEAAFDVTKEVKVPLSFEVYARTDFLYHSDENLKDRIELRTYNEQGRDVLPWTEKQPKVFYARPQEIVLSGMRATGEFKVATSVGRFDVPLALALPKQKVRIDVSAYTSYSPDYGQQRKSPFTGSVTIILDERPDIHVQPLPDNIEAGRPLPVALSVKSLSPITQFDAGLEDPDKPDEFSQEPKKVKATQATDDNWSAKIPTEKLTEGKQKLILLFRAKNGVGETLKRLPIVITVQAAAMPDDKKPAVAKKGRIFGVVAFKNDTKVKCASGRVRLDGGDSQNGENGENAAGRTVEIDDDGKFQFDDVPYGRHTLSARGSKGGVKARGTLDVDLNDSTESQTILVD